MNKKQAVLWYCKINDDTLESSACFHFCILWKGRSMIMKCMESNHLCTKQYNLVMKTFIATIERRTWIEMCFRNKRAQVSKFDNNIRTSCEQDAWRISKRSGMFMKSVKLKCYQNNNRQRIVLHSLYRQRRRYIAGTVGCLDRSNRAHSMAKPFEHISCVRIPGISRGIFKFTKRVPKW